MSVASCRLLVGSLMAAGAALTAEVALAAAPASGFVLGQIQSVSAKTFVLKDSDGSVATSRVLLQSSTNVTEQLTATRAELSKGECVTAMGTKASSGTVEAMRLTISAAVKGSCTSGFFGHGSRPAGAPSGTPPTGTPPAGAPSGGFSGFGNGNFAFAAGKVTKVAGSTLTLKGSSGTSKASVSASTQLTRIATVTDSKIDKGQCARVSGTSANAGATVNATSVALSQPSSSGCSGGFRRP
jgi:hypothetical protein